MATKLYPYKADCDKAGVIIHFKARDDKDARERLQKMVEYSRAQRKHKCGPKDWIVSKEESNG